MSQVIDRPAAGPGAQRVPAQRRADNIPSAGRAAIPPAQPRRPRHRERRRPMRRVVAVLVLAAMVLGWWNFLRPSTLGGPLTFIIVTGQSMEPGLHTDDLAVVQARDSYAKGDVVAFRATPPDGGNPAEGAYVIHRIKGGNGDGKGFVMRGDNNDWDDPWRPTTDEVAGEMLFSVPGAGFAMRWISHPIHLGAVLAGLMTAMVVAAPPRRKPEHSAGSGDSTEHTDRTDTESRPADPAMTYEEARA